FLVRTRSTRPEPSKADTESSSTSSTPFSRWMAVSTWPTSSPTTRASGTRAPSTAVTSIPSWRSEADTSEPMKPSPITTARRARRVAARMRSQSATVRSWKTPSSVAPGTDSVRLRPPLSKGYLRQQERFEDQLVKPAGYYAEQRIQLTLGVRATAVFAKQKLVDLE